MESQNGLGWGDLGDPSCSSPCPEQGQLPPDQLVQTLWPSLMYHQGIYDLWVFQLECCLEKNQKMLHIHCWGRRVHRCWFRVLHPPPRVLPFPLLSRS